MKPTTRMQLQNHALLPNAGIANTGEALLFDSLFTMGEADSFFKTLHSEIAWRQENIKIFGKSIPQPRLTAWYGDLDKTYSYSGITMAPLAWTPTLKEIKARVERVAETTFTSVLLNLYRNESDSMGWHRDNERELGPEPIIGSVSLGTSRRFCFRRYKTKTAPISVELGHGSFLLMRGECQTYWEHSLPKTKESKGPRINLTFRTIK